MIKKILAAISVMAVSMSLFTGMAYASSYELSLATANDGKADEYDGQHINIVCEGASESYSIAGDFYISVPSGTLLTNADAGDYGVVEKVGLVYGSGRGAKYPSITMNLNADGTGKDLVAGDGKDTLIITYQGGYAFSTASDNVLLEFWVTPVDKSKNTELTLEKKSFYQACDSACAVDKNYYPTNVKNYTVAAGTSNVTEVKEDVAHNVNVTSNDDYTITATPATAKKGEEVKLAIDVKKAGYEFDYFKVDGAQIEGNTFTMPDADVTVAAVLKETVVVDDKAAEKLEDKFADGANDNAVAFKKTFDADALAGKTLMKLTAMVDGVAHIYKGGAVAIPNCDGELKLGVVIQYGNAAVNVESLAIELQ